MTCGIYAIKNKHNNKIYIGQSIDIESRLRKHKSELLTNSHPNPFLQDDYNNSPPDSFIFKALFPCKKEFLDHYEKKLIAKTRARDHNYGYNIESGGVQQREVKQSTRDRISHTFLSNHIHQGEDNPFWGQEHTEEVKHELSKNSTKTGVYKVLKVHDENVNQGYYYSYNNEISSKSLEALQKRLQNENIEWKVLNEEKYNNELKQNKADIKKYAPPTGIQYVSKKTMKSTKQGFVYRYHIKNKDHNVELTATKIEKLEKKVRDKGYEWIVLDEEKANALYTNKC